MMHKDLVEWGRRINSVLIGVWGGGSGMDVEQMVPGLDEEGQGGLDWQRGIPGRGRKWMIPHHVT